MKFFATLWFALFAIGYGIGQSEVVQWTAKLEPNDARVGEAARILVEARIKDGWHIYDLKQAGGLIPTSFEIPEDAFLQEAEPIQPNPKKKFDELLKLETSIFEKGVVFAIPVNVSGLTPGAHKLTVTVNWQACDASGCLPPQKTKVPLEVNIAPGEPRPIQLSVSLEIPKQPFEQETGEPKSGQVVDETQQEIEKAKSSGLLAYMGIAFIAGLLALLTPCVFPMIPVTVSFFSKRSGEGKKNLSGALAYCFGIMGTFTGLGLLVTYIFGASGVQLLSANPWVNLGLTLIFVFLAFSLFGVLELRLPSWLVNASQKQTRSGGLLGPVFMGLTFSLTTFTCTVPFVGGLLAGAANGEVMYPLFGMLAFSTAFAVPFFLLALFPGWLSKLPKSGGWLATVKAYMGFIELAFAFKFLSNIDLVWNWQILTRPVFLGIWATLLIMAGLYLLGWILLPSDTSKPGMARRIIGLFTIGIGGYCFAAMNGAPLGQLEAFPPPKSYGIVKQGKAASGEINWIETYDEALQIAKKENKPIFLNFTGHTCVNCRLMEEGMFPRPEIKSELLKFVTAELWTDAGTPEENANAELRIKLTESITNPVYVIMTSEGKVVKIFQGGTNDAEKYKKFLVDGFELASKK